MFLPVRKNGKYVYAGFWLRFCSNLLDILILMPFILITQFIYHQNWIFALCLIIPMNCLFAMYNVFFNARFGGSPGKLGAGIRITRPNGSPIGWSEAWKRSAVDLGFAFVITIITFMALLMIGPARYNQASYLQKLNLQQTHQPRWVIVVSLLQQVWIWSEVLVVLFNKRKRAIHDFIAGTVVIKKEFRYKPGQESDAEEGDDGIHPEARQENVINEEETPGEQTLA